MNNHIQETICAVSAATANAASLDAFGLAMVTALTGQIAFDRFNIGLIDLPRNLFHDAFVYGHNVSGRATGHQRPLDQSVVEAAIHAGDGFYFGHEDPTQWLNRFPRFGPVLDSGIRAMLAVPVKQAGKVVAALVFASNNPLAYEQKSLTLASAVGDSVADRIAALS